jgi:hypothetical protein
LIWEESLDKITCEVNSQGYAWQSEISTRTLLGLRSVQICKQTGKSVRDQLRDIKQDSAFIFETDFLIKSQRNKEPFFIDGCANLLVD